MFDSLNLSCRKLLVIWVELVRRSAWLVILLSVLSTVAAVYYVVGNFSVNTSTEDMLSPDLPFRKNAKAVSQAFPQYSDNIAIVIDAQTPDLAEDAASIFADRLRARPEVFGEVFDLQGSPFFRKHGLLYLDTDELFELSNTLAEAQPFLGVLWRDPTLRGLLEMLSKAIDIALEDKGKAPVEIGTVLDAISDVVTAQKEGRFSHLSWQDLMSGKSDGKEQKPGRRVIEIKPPLDFGSLQPAGDVIGSLRRLAAEMNLNKENGVRVRLTGSAALAHEELLSVEEGMGLAAALSLSLVILLLTGGLRSPRLALGILITLVMGLIWTAAFALYAVGALNLISVAFAVLFIGLSVDFGIHYGLRYKEQIDVGERHRDALRLATSHVGGALTLCAVAAAISFYSFLPTEYTGLAELGLIAGTGMFIALFANLTVLPAILTIVRLRRKEPKPDNPRIAAAKRFVQEKARRIVWGAAIVGVAGVVLLPWARFDFDPLNLRDPKTESVSTLNELMQDNASSAYSITILSASLAEADTLAAKLKKIPEVDGTRTLSNYVPTNQEEKLGIIEGMALYLSPALAKSEQKAIPTPEDRLIAFGMLRRNLERLIKLGEGKAAVAAKHLQTALDDLFGNNTPNFKALSELESRLLTGLPGRLESLRFSLEAGPVTLEDLPRDLVLRQVAATNSVTRLKVFPAGDMKNRAALARFVTAVQEVAPSATGSPVVIYEAGRAVIHAFAKAAALAVVLIVLLLLVLLRSIEDVFMIFVPLALAAVLTVAASILFNLPFNFANVIVLPLLFGLGVASGIHLVVRERDAGSASGVFETSTPRAVTFSALTTIGSFGSIALSSHPGTSSMGLLLTIAISLTLVSTLVVLPALMTYVKEKR
ncbi:MAG: MMPL family transporter [Rhodospirillales bacterium]|nr:MMPL family transporter [Rhodospirillales bacterium]